MSVKSITETKQALGGEVLIGLVTEESIASVLLPQIWQQVYIFEKKFSRFLPSSELSLFNKSSGIKTPISPEYRDLLVCSKHLSELTEGLYNPFILPALQRAGYTQSAAKGYENDPQEDYSDKKVVSIQKLQIGDDWAMIPYGTALDMGGCGKGYLADQIANWLKKHSVKGFWLSFSGDIAAWGKDENGQPLQIAIQDASDPTKRSDWHVSCPASGIGIATSGTFRRDNQPKLNQHHIIDPRTNLPAVTDIKLATVCAKNAVLADVIASCAVILGSEKADSYLKKLGVKGYLIQYLENQNIQIKSYGNLLFKTVKKEMALRYV